MRYHITTWRKIGVTSREEITVRTWFNVKEGESFLDLADEVYRQCYVAMEALAGLAKPQAWEIYRAIYAAGQTREDWLDRTFRCNDLYVVKVEVAQI